MKRMTPCKIVLIYFVTGLLWILFSDLFAARIATSPQMLTRLSVLKGWLYIFVIGVLLYWLISRYASERDRTEKALTVSEQNYRNIIDNIKDIFYRTDKSGTVIMTSPSALSMMGYDSLDEIVGKMKATEFYHDLSQRAILLEKIMKDGFVKDYELTLVRKDGTPVPISLSSTYYTDGNGEFAGFEGFIRDISERKQLEQEREKLIVDLQQALAEVKTLRGILPICSRCKKIRDEKGSWQKLETYISKHTDSQFTHGMCEECAKILYPGFSKKNADETG